VDAGFVEPPVRSYRSGRWAAVQWTGRPARDRLGAADGNRRAVSGCGDASNAAVCRGRRRRHPPFRGGQAFRDRPARRAQASLPTPPSKLGPVGHTRPPRSRRACEPQGSRFLDELEDHMTTESAEQSLRAVISWARYGEAFAYDADGQMFSLENPS